jgi:hypothetical protein
VRTVEATDCVAVTAAFTVSEKVAVALAPFVSVTVTVYVAAVLVMEEVPVTAPVADAMLRPVGSVGATL